MQTLLGLALLAIGIVFVSHVAGPKHQVNRVSVSDVPEPSGEATTSKTRQTLIGSQRIVNNTPIVLDDGSSATAKAVAKLVSRIRYDTWSVELMLRFAGEYNVPADVMVAHWYQESLMDLGTDPDGVGRYNPLVQIQRKQSHGAVSYLKQERALRKIVWRCGYNIRTMKSGPTGDLGPMQFMPETWLIAGTDGDGDGKACPYTLADAFASGANHLRNCYRQRRSWDGAMMCYAGGISTSRTVRRYVAVSRPKRRAFCRILRDATNKENLPCSL